MGYAATAIGLFIFLLAFFVLNGPVGKPGSPLPSPPTIESVAYCQDVPESEALTFNAPRDETSKCPDGPSGRYLSGESAPRNIFTGETTYQLIKKNVPLNRSFFTKEDKSNHSTLASDEGIETTLDPNKYRLYFPQITGEIVLGQAPYSRTRDCAERSYLNTGRMYFIDYGLAFGLVLKDGKPIEVRGKAIGGGADQVFWLTDVFKDINREDQVPPEAFVCNSTNGSSASASTAPQGLSVMVPQQQISKDDSQLQLQYFTLGFPSNANQVGGQVVDGWYDSCKPAVYLYPEKKQLVNVQVFPKGELSYTNPPYQPGKGWTVEAFPGGSLFNSQNSSPITRNYLYYESRILDSEIKKPETGWVVSGTRIKGQELRDLKELLDEVLPKLGLNQKEAADFKDYWLNKLPDSPYYFVGFVNKAQRDYLETLKVVPNPDTSIRFSLYFEMLDEPIIVKEPEIKTPVRDGFTLVDWGGMVKLHPGTPFTCSQ